MFDLHHFGLAASNPTKAEQLLGSLGYRCGPAIWDPLQKVILRWCEAPGTVPVEIVSPGGITGPLDRILADQPSSFYHLCYEIRVPMQDALDALGAGGARLITVLPPTPAVLFGGRRVSFHMARGFGLLELLHPFEARE